MHWNISFVFVLATQGPKRKSISRWIAHSIPGLAFIRRITFMAFHSCNDFSRRKIIWKQIYFSYIYIQSFLEEIYSNLVYVYSWQFIFCIYIMHTFMISMKLLAAKATDFDSFACRMCWWWQKKDRACACCRMKFAVTCCLGRSPNQACCMFFLEQALWIHRQASRFLGVYFMSARTPCNFHAWKIICSYETSMCVHNVLTCMFSIHGYSKPSMHALKCLPTMHVVSSELVLLTSYQIWPVETWGLAMSLQSLEQCCVQVCQQVLASKAKQVEKKNQKKNKKKKAIYWNKCFWRRYQGPSRAEKLKWFLMVFCFGVVQMEIVLCYLFCLSS